MKINVNTEATMSKDKIELTTEVPVQPILFYQHWLSSEGHTLMTGAMAQISPEQGAEFLAQDGYISGKNLELEPNQRIYQSWRTNDFSPTTEDAELEVLLEKGANRSTKITIKHWNLPEGEGEKYKQFWEEKYFEPMHKYFEST